MKKLLLIFLSFYSVTLFCQNPSPKAKIVKHFSAYEEKGVYCGWPTIVQADNGDIIVPFCSAEEHHSPTGKMVYIKSSDKGKTWSKPEIIYDSPLDDREASIMKLRDGRLVMFLGSSYHPTKLFEEDFVKLNAYNPEVLKRWTEYTKTDKYRNAEPLKGSMMRISTDNGKTWSEPVRSPKTFRAGVELEDGTILICGYESNSKITLYRTDTKQKEWKWESDSVQFPIFKNSSFGEAVIYKMTSGRIIMLVRATAINPYDNSDRRNLLWETYSDDNGKTWHEPYPTPIWGYPPHILQLKDGRIIVSYSYRRVPFGERVCISEDGITWKHENELILRDDAPNEDLGYPVSLEIEPGKIMTIYYQPNVPKGTVQEMKPPDPNRVKPGVLGTIWNAPKKGAK